jgi:hypothetical protein
MRKTRKSSRLRVYPDEFSKTVKALSQIYHCLPQESITRHTKYPAEILTVTPRRYVLQPVSYYCIKIKLMFSVPEINTWVIEVN